MGFRGENVGFTCFVLKIFELWFFLKFLGNLVFVNEKIPTAKAGFLKELFITCFLTHIKAVQLFLWLCRRFFFNKVWLFMKKFGVTLTRYWQCFYCCILDSSSCILITIFLLAFTWYLNYIIVNKIIWSLLINNLILY